MFPPMEIGEATIGEMERVRAWLPLPGGDAPSSRVFVVRSPTGLPFGAAAVYVVHDGEGPEGRLLLYVSPARRRKGAGRALLDSAIRYLRELAVPAIRTGRAVPEDSPAAGFLKAAGFAPRIVMEHLTTSISGILDRVGPVVARLREAGRIPSGVVVGPLSADRPAEVTEFMVAHIGGRPERLAEFMESGSGAFHPELSTTIRQEGVLIAALLVRPGPNCFRADLRAVAPTVRGTWANALLLERFATGAAAAGVESVQFEADPDRHLETVRFAERTGGARRSREIVFGRKLQPAHFSVESPADIADPAGPRTGSQGSSGGRR